MKGGFQWQVQFAEAVPIVFDVVNYTLLTLVFFIIAYPLYFVIIASFSDPYLVTTDKYGSIRRP